MTSPCRVIAAPALYSTLLFTASTASAASPVANEQISAIATETPTAPSRNTKALPTTSAARAGAQAAVHLNHFYVTLDAASCAAIRDSVFLKEQFGVFEARTTKRGDITYTGMYFYGDQTYFELFNVEDKATGP